MSLKPQLEPKQMLILYTSVLLHKDIKAVAAKHPKNIHVLYL